MAKIKTSALISDIRNKLNGSTFQGSRTGLVLRTNAITTRGATAPQLVRRGTTARLAAMWAELTEEQRKMWAARAETYTRENTFGDRTKYNGYSLFVRSNFYRRMMELTPVNTPPHRIAFPELQITGSSSYDLGDNVIWDMGWVTPPGILNIRIMFYITKGFAALGSPASHKFKFIKSVNIMAGSTQLDTNDFGGRALFPPEYYVFIKAMLIDTGAGYPGPIYTIKNQIGYS